jgi:hypothetical protein
MSGIDWTAVFAVVGPAIAGLGTWLKMRKPNQAKIDAAVAQLRSDESMSDAEGTLYKRLREEIDALRQDLSRMRAELDIERKHGRKMEKHIWVLERMLRDAGLDPPALVLDDPHAPVPSQA